MPNSSGQTLLAAQQVSLEALMQSIPPLHRGISFDRVFQRKVELAFATVWAERNTREDLLRSLITPFDEHDAKERCIPKNEREWEVACMAAATVIQWLPTNIGCGFLEQAFREAEMEFSYKFPQPSDV